MNETVPSDGRRWVLSLVEEYEPRLTRYAARILGDEDSARDVVQFAFLKLCDQQPEAIRGRVDQWLFTVCRNKAVDALRSRSRVMPLADERVTNSMSSEPDPAVTAERKDLYSRLNQLVATLPDGQREAVDLWSEGFTYRQIADITGRKENSTRVQVHRALKYLRTHPVAMRLMDEPTHQRSLAPGESTSEVRS